MDFGMSAGVSDAVGIGAVVMVITYASLIIGELVPKQIALHNPMVRNMSNRYENFVPAASE
ncbi:MAG: hypothetical protein ACM3IH_00890 [Sphingobacteriales bacterium]